VKKSKISSWGNTSNKNVILIKNLKDSAESTIVSGNLNSYGDASIPFSNNSLDISGAQNEGKAFHNSQLTIEEYVYTKKKLLYGIPGKGNVTIGGAIASDAHGKDNLWGGGFSRNLDKISISLPSGEKIIASDEKNKDLFSTTIGGFGLTGIINGATFKKNNIQFSNFFSSSCITGKGVENLTDIYVNKNNTYWVGWIDLLDKDKKWVVEESKPISNNKVRYKVKREQNLNVSIPFVGSNLFGSMSFINYLYFQNKKRLRAHEKHISSILYPLNKWSDTKNISKKRKIVQIQFSLPTKNQIFLDSLLDLLIYKQNPLLCSIKRLNNNLYENNLSFIQNGWTVAVDFPYHSFNNDLVRKFYKRLIELEGKVYLAKDSTLNSNEFKEMFLNHSKWVDIVKKIDPYNKFQSELSTRLGLKKW